MVMRTMRENTKWIMLVLTIAFVGWLVFDWVQGGGGMQGSGTNPVVGTVNGEQIRYAEWNRFLQSQLDQARRQVEASLSDEQMHRLREQSWDQFINQKLVRQELDRLGIEVTDAEIRQAFRSSPPPGLRDHPAFQTDGQFDYEKYRQFFAGPNVDESLLVQIESYYRETLPRLKLYRLVSEEVTVTDEQLWQHYRDRNQRARVRYVAADPSSAIPDTAVTVTDQEIRDYYREHRQRYRRPRTAVVDVLSLTVQPSADDSARARSRLDSLRSLVAGGSTSFGELVSRVSDGERENLQGGEIGPVSRGDLIAPLERAAFSLPVGQLSEPIGSPSGYHLIRVTSRQNQEATFQHLLVPVRLSTDSEDRLFDIMDRLEGIALRSDLATAADSLGRPARNDVRLTEGSRFVPGAGALGVAVEWCFDAETRVGDLSQFFENAAGYHILELEDRLPEGTRPLEEVREEIRTQLLARKKADELRARMEEAAERIRAGASMRDVARRHGWAVDEAGPFSRAQRVPGLGRGTEAVGAAFGLEEGEVAGPLDADGRMALVRLLEKTSVSRETFESQKARLRAQLESQRRQAYLDRWLQALRESSQIQDLRGQLTSGDGRQVS